MKNQNDDWDVLDLTDAESEVLWALIERGTLSVSAISRTAKVARTTVDAALRRLKARKLVRRVPSRTGYLSLWKAVRKDKAKRELLDVVESFNRESSGAQGVVGNIDAEDVGIKVFRGKEQIKEIQRKILENSPTERVFVIQGNKSAEGVVKDFDAEFIHDFVREFKKKKVIMEGINGERVKEMFQKMDTETLNASFGRMIISSLLPDKYMEFDVDMLIVRDSVMFFDARDEIVISIQNKPIVEMLKSITLFLRDEGKHFNINKFIQGVLESRTRA